MIDLVTYKMNARSAIAKLKHANQVAGGSRMGTVEAIELLEKIPELITQLRR